MQLGLSGLQVAQDASHATEDENTLMTPSEIQFVDEFLNRMVMHE